MARKALSERRPLQPNSYIDPVALGLLMRDIDWQDGMAHPAIQLLRLIMDNIPQAIFWKDRNSVYVWCNRNFANDAGYENPEDVSGKTDFDLPWTQEEAEWYRKIDQQVMETDTPIYQLYETQTHADGQITWVVTNKMPLHDPEGNVVGVLGTYEDITELKLKEEELRKAREELEIRVQERTAAEREQRAFAEALREISTTLNSTLNLNEVLDRILTEIQRILPHQMATIILVEGQKGCFVRARPAGSANEGEWFEINKYPNLVKLLETKSPLIIHDVVKDRQWVHYQNTHWIRSYLGAPIIVKGEVIGFISLYSDKPHFFDTQKAERLMAFASHAAIAIHNAKLYEQAQELAVINERQRLARELHDAVSQTLWTASIIADVLPVLWDKDPEEGKRNLEQLRKLVRGALAEMRTLLIELRPSSLQQTKFVDLLHQLAQATMSRKKMEVRVITAGNEFEIQPETKLSLYRIVQEALNNAAKHSFATKTEINVLFQNSHLRIYIEDNGRGFDPNNPQIHGMGLEIMRERATSASARLTISSTPGKGTKIEIFWPQTSNGE